MKIAVTGASGFIGREVCRVLDSKKHEVIRLSRTTSPSPDKPVAHEWHLGQPLPEECNDCSCVLHLASATLIESRSMTDALRLDLYGTKILRDQARIRSANGQAVRFIFLSSQSSRKNAVNTYGRSKWQIEKMLDAENEVIVRPGLVYDKQGSSVFSLFVTLASLPVVPIISSRPCIQLINVTDLAECLVKLVVLEKPEKLYYLGASRPLTFKQVIELAAANLNRKPPLSIPLPASMAKGIAKIFDTLFHPSPSLTERVTGLTSLHPMNTKPSLLKLDISLKQPGSDFI